MFMCEGEADEEVWSLLMHWSSQDSFTLSPTMTYAYTEEYSGDPIPSSDLHTFLHALGAFKLTQTNTPTYI